MRITSLFIAGLLLLVGCTSKPGTTTPQEVAGEFWNAVIRGDGRAAKALTVRQRIETKTVIKVVLKRVETLGTRVVNGRAFVPTRLIFTIPLESLKSNECNATFDTELLKVEGRWLVDDIVTMENYRKSVDERVVVCGAKMLDMAIDESLEEFELFRKELGKESEELGRVIQKSMKKWKEEIIEMLRQMQKSLEELEPPAEPPKSLPEKGERI
ncbi:hypothetical protein [Hydrogenimonas sp.]|uniref:hypothetical protein n=1 Tax=Hydrogenimonas sp. TaxID=2231112 RepID=UPI002626F31B|nr:hypothetical protein [Hydrogenimonas sp.]